MEDDHEVAHVPAEAQPVLADIDRRLGHCNPGKQARSPATPGVASTGGGRVWAARDQQIPGQCCAQTLAQMTPAG